MLSPGERSLAAREPRLPGFGLLLDPAAFLEALREALPACDVASAHLEYLRYKPGTNLLAGYQARIGGRPVALHAKTYAAAEAGKVARELRRAGVPGPLDRATVPLPDGLGVVRAFPNDANLPGLRVLAEAVAHGETVAQLGLGVGELSALRYKPERRWVGRFDPAGSGRSVVLKAHTALRYTRAAQGAGAFREGRVLRLAPAGPAIPELHVLTAGWLPGSLLDSELVTGRATPAMLALAGTALAELHAQPVDGLAFRSRASEAASLVELATSISWLLPELAPRLPTFVHRVASALTEAPPLSRPVHGDCYAKQMLVDGPHLGLLDLDQAAAGDPAQDLGLFVAHLERDVLRGRIEGHRLLPLREAFFDGYRAEAGALPERVGLYTIASLLRLLPDPFRHREPAWERGTEALLARAEQLAAELPAGHAEVCA